MLFVFGKLRIVMRGERGSKSPTHPINLENSQIRVANNGPKTFSSRLFLSQ